MLWITIEKAETVSCEGFTIYCLCLCFQHIIFHVFLLVKIIACVPKFVCIQKIQPHRWKNFKEEHDEYEVRLRACKHKGTE